MQRLDEKGHHGAGAGLNLGETLPSLETPEQASLHRGISVLSVSASGVRDPIDPTGSRGVSASSNCCRIDTGRAMTTPLLHVRGLAREDYEERPAAAMPDRDGAARLPSFFTISSTISRGCGAIETTMGCSSGCGSSSAANWLSSSEGGMKCPSRAASRRAIRSRSPYR